MSCCVLASLTVDFQLADKDTIITEKEGKIKELSQVRRRRRRGRRRIEVVQATTDARARC